MCARRDRNLFRNLGREIGLKQLNERPEFSRCRHQALTRQGIEIFIGRVRRILKPQTNLMHRAAKQPLCQAQMPAKKLIGMLNIDPVGREGRIWKMFKILRHDDIAAPNNRRRQNMTIIRIGKLKRRN